MSVRLEPLIYPAFPYNSCSFNYPINHTVGGLIHATSSIQISLIPGNAQISNSIVCTELQAAICSTEVILADEMEQPRAWIAIAVAMAMMVLPYNCMATNYTVGGSQEWNLGVNYVTWATGKSFHVNDILIFTYSSAHDVLEVSKSAYDSCSTSNSLQTYNGGNTAIALDSVGAKYFICGTAGHCTGGMKLAITVTAASTTPSTTVSPPPPSTSAAVAASFMQIKDCVVLMGSLFFGSLAVRIL